MKFQLTKITKRTSKSVIHQNWEKENREREEGDQMWGWGGVRN